MCQAVYFHCHSGARARSNYIASTILLYDYDYLDQIHNYGYLTLW